MVHLQRPLSQQSAVDLGELPVRFAGLGCRGSQQHARHALEIFQAQRRRLQSIGVSNSLGLIERVAVAGLRGGEAIPGRRVLLTRPRVERRPLVVGRPCAGYRFVAPHCRPLVVGTNLRDEIGGVDLRPPAARRS